MRSFGVFFRNFLKSAFPGPLAYLLHFGVPVATFIGMYLLLRMNESASFAGVQAIGLVLYFTMIQAVMIVSLVLKEREQGVESRILVSPASALAYLAGNGAAAAAILGVQVVVSVVLMTIVLAVPIGVAPLPLVAVLFAFSLTSVGFAFLICALTDQSSTALLAANFVVMFTSLIGGSFFPAEFLSPAMQNLAIAIPQYWAMRAIREIQSGGTPAESGLPVVILLLFGALFLVVRSAIARAPRVGR